MDKRKRRPRRSTGARICRDIVDKWLATHEPIDEAKFKLESAINLYDDTVNGGDINDTNRQCRLMVELLWLRYGPKAEIREYRTIPETAGDALVFIRDLARSHGLTPIERTADNFFRCKSSVELENQPARLLKLLAEAG